MGKHNQEILSLLEALKHQTDELLVNQQMYNEMVENNSDGLLVVDRYGVICFVNNMAASMFNRKKTKKLLGEVFAFNAVPNETLEIEIATDNAVRTVEMSTRKIDWNGHSARLVVLRPASERGKLRSSLQKASETLKTLINASPLAIISVDMTGAVTLWSKAAEEIFSWTEIEMRGQKFHVENTPLEEIFERVMEGGRFFKQEVSGKFGLYGTNKIFNLWAIPLNNAAGTISSLMLMIADVTEIKLQKQQMWLLRWTTRKRKYYTH